jgi:hypothetical protein
MNTPLNKEISTLLQPYNSIQEAAFLVASPFQALCALEAISYFKVQKADFYILPEGVSSKMTLDFLLKQGYKGVLMPSEGNSYFLKWIKCGHKKYDYFFVGDYFFGNILYVLLWSNRGANIIYLDDGNSTLGLLLPKPRDRFGAYESLKKRLSCRLFSFFKDLKRVNRCFFSIFDLEGRGFPYPSIKNNFEVLKRGMDNTPTEGVYIIGTNTSGLGIDKGTFIKNLEYIKDYVSQLGLQDSINYCPHRRDENNYDEELKKMGMMVFPTEVSVEVDFIRKRLSPLYVFGFGSTAMITLKFLYPQANVINFKMHTNNSEIDSEYRELENEYSRYGIPEVEIEQLNELQFF